MGEKLYLEARCSRFEIRSTEKVFLLLLLLLLLLRRTPRTLEGGPIKLRHLLGNGREDSEWGAKDY